MIITLSGSNDFMIDIELKKILSNFKEKHGEIAIEQIDASELDFQTIIEAVSNLSFLSPAKLIILKRGSDNKVFVDSLDKLVESMPSTNDLLIVEPNIDKRLNYFKQLKKITDFRTYDALSPDQLTKWTSDFVKDIGGTIDISTSRYLLEVAGLSQMRLANEITKLVSYQKDVNRNSIDLLVEPLPQTTIFQLLDAAFSGRNGELLKIYDDQRKQKIEPQQIIAMLTWQLHILAVIKTSGDNSPAEIAKKSKMNPYVVSKSFSIANRASLSEIKTLASHLLELDIKLKNTNVDTDEALLQLLLSISI